MNPDTRMLLTVSDAHVAYGKVEAVRAVSLDVADNEIVTIIGANGAGKTTLLNAIMGILTLKGHATFAGEDIARLEIEDRVAAGSSKIVPGPFHKGFDFCAGGGEQSGVHSQPRGECDWTVNLKSMLSHFGYARVAPDDCHDAFVQIVERGLRLTRNFQQNI